MEVLFITDTNRDSCNVNVVELSTGENITSYKGDISSSNTLSHIRSEYVISAVPNKPFVNVFEMNRRGQQPLKVATPGVVQSLTVSNCGNYIAAGVEEKVLLWDSINGDLLVILSKHYQDVKCLSFTHDADFLISSGLDCIMYVWDIGQVLDVSAPDLVACKEPTFCWSSHSKPVTAICCSTIGGVRSRVYSSSSDMTVKIHDINTGFLLHSLQFDSEITSICVNAIESMLLAGDVGGDIWKRDLVNVGNSILNSENNHLDVNTPKDNFDDFRQLEGHTKDITCLQFNINASVCVSAANDQTVRIWSMTNGGCAKILNFKGFITNLMLIRAPEALSSCDSKPLYAFPKLGHSVLELSLDSKDTVLCRLDQAAESKDHKETSSLQELIENAVMRHNAKKETTPKGGIGTDLQQLTQQVERLTNENKKMRDFIVDKILPL